MIFAQTVVIHHEVQSHRKEKEQETLDARFLPVKQQVTDKGVVNGE
jgi:hypothetical protein